MQDVLLCVQMIILPKNLEGFFKEKIQLREC